jgi:DNA repair protein SbcD/Mre11
MRFLHTSDWHIGRNVRGQSRLQEQQDALQEVLSLAQEKGVDCLLVAGDIFDTAAPPPEAEALVYAFFRELYGAAIPAVIIAGNHDHPRRLDAVAPLLGSLGIHMRGVPRGPGDGALIDVQSRDKRERAVVAALPWINERDVVDFTRLQGETGAPLMQYAERVQEAMRVLADGFEPEAVSVLVTHLLADDAMVGPGGGERELHMAMGIYGVKRAALPVGAQYIALGHVHKAQDISCASRAAYSGSLLQLDFGERDQQKYVNLVEVHARQPAVVTQLPISSGRRLVDIGMPGHGVPLNELARYKEETADAWARVFVDVDIPVANLAQLVRAELPNAVHVERARSVSGADTSEVETRAHLGPVEMFTRFYEGSLGRGHEPSAETLALFRTLLNEEEHETAEA